MTYPSEIQNKLLIGDCREILPTLPDGSVNCCVTSPPYYLLRDYGHPDQIGLEETPEQYIETLVNVFREVRRALRKDGTLWVSIGDTYAGGGAAYGSAKSTLQGAKQSGVFGAARIKKVGAKPKDLIGIPWMLAFALRADGWYLRQDIIWHKPNPMPESVTDRCTKAHEYIFLLSKSARYYYDSRAIADCAIYTRTGVRSGVYSDGTGTRRNFGRHKSGGFDNPKETRNRRSVWTVPTSPYSGAHFAVFPQKLIEPCILAGCPEGGTVLDPFGGSGTTAQVSNANRRNAITIELNPEYLKLQKKRVNGNQIKLI